MKKESNLEENQKLLLETRITEILSRLSIEPSDELENEFQELLKQKRELDN
jgi:pleuromutilin/lincosamide/streptogramin A transport system ATP-binding/permease protein